MTDEGQSQAAAIESDLRRSLLTYDQVNFYKEQIEKLTEAILELELAGTAEVISMQIGQFQYWKGKIATYQDLLDDNNTAAEQIKQ